MKNSKYKLALATAVLLLGNTCLSADGDQPWHISYQIGGADLDNSRNTNDTDIWQGVGFGYFLSPNFSLDLEYDEVESSYSDFNVAVPGATYDDWNLSTLGLMGRYYFGRNAWKPYVLAGVGSTKHSNILDSGRDLSWSLGLGILGQMSEHFSVRGQLMWRRDTDDQTFSGGPSSFDDFIYSVGLNFDFGGKPPAPPPPPPEPAPAPAPEPARAAPPPPPPNPDLDGDGVLNEKDKCPNTRPGAVVDLDGCEVEAVISLEGVHFDFDKASLRPEAMVILDNAAGLLSTHERVVVEVAGHTDSVGSEAYNQGLSERRANAVLDYLVSKGVKASRLTARGYGEAQPVASNDTAEGRQANRRVELIVLDR
jgi:OOP family OmpA-OmpF porin